MTVEELRAALEALSRYEFTSGVGSHAHPDALERAAVLAALPSDGVIVSEEERYALDPDTLWAVLAGIGIIDNGTWVAFTRADADSIAETYAALRKESGDA